MIFDKFLPGTIHFIYLPFIQGIFYLYKELYKDFTYGMTFKVLQHELMDLFDLLLTIDRFLWNLLLISTYHHLFIINN